MNRVTKIVLPVAIVAIGFFLMFFLLGLKKDAPKRQPVIPVKVVQTEIVKLKPIYSKIEAFGRTTTSQPVELYAEAAGQVEDGNISFQPAQSFSKGDLLYKIDDRQAIMKVSNARLELFNAVAAVLPEIKVDFSDQFDTWQKYFKMLSLEQKIEPLPETNNEKLMLYLSRFNIYKLYYSLRDLEIQLDKHYYYASFDGSIITAQLREGSFARNGSLMGKIINLEELEVALPVETRNVFWLDVSQPVVLYSSEFDGKFTGKISRIGSEIDAQSQTVEVFIKLDDNNSATLINGMFLKADISGIKLNNSFSISPKAVYEDRYVYLIENGKFVLREIEMARREASQIIISQGLNNGDTVVTEVMQGVSSGMPAKSKAMITEGEGK